MNATKHFTGQWNGQKIILGFVLILFYLRYWICSGFIVLRGADSGEKSFELILNLLLKVSVQNVSFVLDINFTHHDRPIKHPIIHFIYHGGDGGQPCQDKRPQTFILYWMPFWFEAWIRKRHTVCLPVQLLFYDSSKHSIFASTCSDFPSLFGFLAAENETQFDRKMCIFPIQAMAPKCVRNETIRWFFMWSKKKSKSWSWKKGFTTWL